MDRSALKAALPGAVGLGFLTLTSALWTFWSFGELYYEGWGLALPIPLMYLTPTAACLALTLVILRWPRAGGMLVSAIALVFTIWVFRLTVARGGLTVRSVLSWLPVSGLAVLTGLLLFADGQRRWAASRRGTEAPQGPWYRRHLRALVTLGVPALVALAVSAEGLPRVLLRVDDGIRTARLIEGTGVRLVWAPEGPGWNWKQPWGGYPSWTMLARYGLPPIGLGEQKNRRRGPAATVAEQREFNLCRFLSQEGDSLLETPQDVWRLPTADEMIRSLVRRGSSAGCELGPGQRRARCARRPEKESPLWATDQEPIYMWAAEEHDSLEAVYVSYNGWVEHQPKHWGNPRHGYRCVREP